MIKFYMENPKKQKELAKEYDLSEKQMHDIRMSYIREIQKRGALRGIDQWFAVNDFLNTIRVMAGKEPRPWTDNPYLQDEVMLL